MPGKYVEARGRKAIGPKKELEHVRIYGHPDGTPENPAWVVEHHNVGGGDPDAYEFDDAHELAAHVLNHIGAHGLVGAYEDWKSEQANRAEAD